MYLLDTNIVSESSKKQPDANLGKWYKRISVDESRISSVSIGEIRRGIVALDLGTRKTELELWYEHLRPSFENRIIAPDAAVFNCWAQEIERLKRIRRTPQILDALIAATALTHNLVMVTRNVEDFSIFNLKIINPFELS